MFQFYWEMLKSAPLLIIQSFARVEGWIAVVAFILAFYNKEFGQKIASWDGFSRTWAIVPVVLYFAFLLLEANFKKYESAQEFHAAKIEALDQDLNKMNMRLEVHKVEVEKLAIQNAELMRGAPVLTGRAAQLDAILKEILKFADTALTEEEFTKEAGQAWIYSASTLTGDLRLSEKTHPAQFVNESYYEGTYESYMQVVASLRRIAIDLRESDLLD